MIVERFASTLSRNTRAPALLVLALAVFTAIGASAGEHSLRDERQNGYIEALNASSARRTKVLEAIYNELRGPEGREMHEMLREALSRQNSLILQGVVEAMAMLGDPRDVANLEALLATSDKVEVKLLVIRLLPAFCLPSERARFNYIHYAAGHERVPREGVLEPLRRPPLTRRGRLDPGVERLQSRVIRSLASQFDPVGAALRYIDDILYSQAARRAVTHFVGNALGSDPGRWARIWVAQGEEMDLRAPDEVEEIRLSALVSLSDMGAEGLPEVIESFKDLESAGGDVLRQAAFETMAVMCRSAFDGYPALAAMHFGAEDQVEAENWRRRWYASAANLAVYTAETASDMLTSNLDTSVFNAATAALGAALSYPTAFPDPSEGLAQARTRGLVRLERLLMMPDISREKRSAVTLALGAIGSARAVSAIASIIDSPYCSPEFGTEGTRLAESAIDALRTVATGGHEGATEARAVLLRLLSDARVYTPLRSGAPPVGLAHMVLWRLQRLARSNDINLDAEVWRGRLGW